MSMTKADELTFKKAHCRCMNLGNQCTNHHYADSCFGEKPGETWEDRFVKEFPYSAVDWSALSETGVPRNIFKEVKSFIAKEIQSAVEAERRRIRDQSVGNF